MLFIHSFKFIFYVFLLYNNVYFDETQRYKQDDNQRTRNIYIRKLIIDELDFLKKTVIIQ